MDAASTEPNSTTPPPPLPNAGQGDRKGLPLGSLIFCGVLIAVGCGFLVIAVKRMAASRDVGPTAMTEINLADEAKKYVRENKPAPLSDSLEKILEEAKRVHFDSDALPLLGKAAPDINVNDVDGKSWSLKEKLKQGPVVIVFYLGYWCNHCVSQLFDVNEDIARFRELGADVVAISPDPAGTTLLRYKEYGRFNFPVLPDVNKHLAQAYGVFTPANGKEPEDMAHGTFVVDQAGIIRWVRTGTTPFGHNPTLIYELAKIKGLVKPDK